MSTPVVVVSREELDELIRKAVSDVVSGVAPRTREFLTQEQLAGRLGISQKSVQRMVNRDGLPVHELGPKLQRFLWTEVEQWLTERGKNLGGTQPPRRGHLRHVRK